MEPSTFRGSCLCGAVAYEVSGEVARFYHCHCSRCRKATGTGHASNLMIKGGRIAWLRGEDRLKEFKVPDAERFYTRFCGECGSPMPRDVPELGAVVIAAGSLDHDIDNRPEARIFNDSRAGWSCAGDGLEVFAEYPPVR